MKIDETKLKYELRLVRVRHKKQDLEDKIDSMEWDGRKMQREADNTIAAHAAEAATAKAKMKASQDEARTAASEAAKADAKRVEAIAAAETATAKAAQAERDADAASAIAKDARAEADAAIEATKRAESGQAKAFAGVRKLRKMLTSVQAVTRPDGPELKQAKDTQLSAAPRTTPSTPSPSPAWVLLKPSRFQGYGRPVHAVLKAAHASNLPLPTARDVLEAFREKKPPEVHAVLADELNYYDATGTIKAATVDNIRKVIARLVRKAPDPTDFIAK